MKSGSSSGGFDKDYIKTLKKHNIELTENLKEEEVIIAYNEGTEI